MESRYIDAQLENLIDLMFEDFEKSENIAKLLTVIKVKAAQKYDGIVAQGYSEDRAASEVKDWLERIKEVLSQAGKYNPDGTVVNPIVNDECGEIIPFSIHIADSLESAVRDVERVPHGPDVERGPPYDRTVLHGVCVAPCSDSVYLVIGGVDGVSESPDGAAVKDLDLTVLDTEQRDSTGVLHGCIVLVIADSGIQDAGGCNLQTGIGAPSLRIHVDAASISLDGASDDLDVWIRA